MFGSFTQGAAWLFLIMLVTITHRSVGKPSQLIVCSQPNNFTVQINDRECLVHDTKLLIKYNPQVQIFSYPGIEPINVVFNDITVEFKGYMSLERSAFKDLLPDRLTWNASDIILGIGTLQKLNNSNYAIEECRLFMPSNIQRSTNMPKVVEDIIIHYAQFCAEENLCQRIGTITPKELKNINIYEEHGNNVPHNHSMNTTQRFELIMNVPVDFALKNAMNYIKQNNRSIIKVPDIKETFNVGLGMKGYIDIINGTFEDLSTLKRTEDAFLSNVEETSVIEAGFGLSVAKFTSNYKLKVSPINVSGKILGTVEGLAMETKVIIHYDKICNINLDYIKVTEIGKMKFELTGLGPLNHLTSKLITWLTKTWQNRIVKVVEIDIREIVENQLNERICKAIKSYNDSEGGI